MITKVMPRLGAFEAWRAAARELLAANVPPDQVRWNDHAAQKPLFDETFLCPVKSGVIFTVPREFPELARKIIAHRSDQRFSWAYRLLWRLQAEPQLLSNPADSDVHHLHTMAKSVSRDCHKMKAFVRFRELESAGDCRAYGAWFEPDHNILELTGPFFADRFGDMDWIISTPHAVAAFVGGRLSYAPPNGVRPTVDDATEDLWRTYYSNIFNPARLKLKAMQSEMPKKYWTNLPEAALIPGLISGAAHRVQEMRNQLPAMPPAGLDKFKAPVAFRDAPSASTFASIADLRTAAIPCTRCPLHCHATQTVFGEGSARAGVMFVGEQPGDQEDIAGKPFVGPAGRIFDDALAAAEIRRPDVYITNAVKHFKFSTRGKHRIHERPDRSEIQHCKWWLDKELALIKPDLVVALGATALFALTGKTGSIASSRGFFHQTLQGQLVLSTYHPSAILRNRDKADAIRRDFFADIDNIKIQVQGGTLKTVDRLQPAVP
jgi:uracil-DNA glycosylase